jgi:sec-independent protein translocase protein TatA
MLGLDNPIHIAFILVLLLLVFGAKRLPEMGKSLGTGLRGFKESISGEHDPTAHLTAASSATPMTVTQPVTTTPTPVHVEEPSAAIAVTPVITAEPVVVDELVREPVPVWRV